MPALTPKTLARLPYSSEDIASLRQLGQYRGKQELFAQQRPEILETLRPLRLPRQRSRPLQRPLCRQAHKLKALPAPLLQRRPPADILAAVADPSAAEWNPAIRELVEFGEVEKEGRKRGTRYRIPVPPASGLERVKSAQGRVPATGGK